MTAGGRHPSSTALRAVLQLYAACRRRRSAAAGHVAADLPRHAAYFADSASSHRYGAGLAIACPVFANQQVRLAVPDPADSWPSLYGEAVKGTGRVIAAR